MSKRETGYVCVRPQTKGHIYIYTRIDWIVVLSLLILISRFLSNLHTVFPLYVKKLVSHINERDLSYIVLMNSPSLRSQLHTTNQKCQKKIHHFAKRRLFPFCASVIHYRCRPFTIISPFYATPSSTIRCTHGPRKTHTPSARPHSR